MVTHAWRLAVGTLTAVPVRPPGRVDRRVAGTAMVLAPLAAAPLGVLAAAVLALGQELRLAPLAVAVVALGAVVLGNRAFHLDGLSDTVDGLAASYDRERSLAVMKTGTAGPAGVAAIVLVLALQVTGLAALPHTWQGALLGGASVMASRGALAMACMRGVPAARSDGLGVTYTGTVPRWVVASLWLLIAAVLSALAGWAGLAWWRGALAVASAAVAAGVVVACAVRRLGGVTGDVFGAAVEVALAAALVALS